ncbi:hypothetical protein H6P81_016180 [Aristolochia fimbriata]|uniref:Uncharacterized protein n=1 Tax=Aristolochia fimbriata TaxID=158543 RepID=A0AAV7E7I1_ARIFI|nr:hypothetical protein H6P81_016180 [Aristolochia fimbriata]
MGLLRCARWVNILGADVRENVAARVFCARFMQSIRVDCSVGLRHMSNDGTASKNVTGVRSTHLRRSPTTAAVKGPRKGLKKGQLVTGPLAEWWPWSGRLFRGSRRPWQWSVAPVQRTLVLCVWRLWEEGFPLVACDSVATRRRDHRHNGRRGSADHSAVVACHGAGAENPNSLRAAATRIRMIDSQSRLLRHPRIYASSLLRSRQTPLSHSQSYIELEGYCALFV